METIEPPSPPGHMLHKIPATEPFKCDACKELGFGSHYACETDPNCNFHLHEECAPLGDTSPPANHHLFGLCKFVILRESTNRVCDACGREVLGISYRCNHGNEKTAHDVHPCCLNLPTTVSGDDGVELRLRSEVSSKCRRCGKKEAAKNVKGWSYVSDRGRVSYHVACVKDMVLEKYEEGYFRGRTYRGAAETGHGQLAVPSTASTASNALARRTSNFGGKTKAVLKIAALVLKLVIYAIFGHPGAVVEVLIQSLI